MFTSSIRSIFLFISFFFAISFLYFYFSIIFNCKLLLTVIVISHVVTKWVITEPHLIWRPFLQMSLSQHFYLFLQETGNKCWHPAKNRKVWSGDCGMLPTCGNMSQFLRAQNVITWLWRRDDYWNFEFGLYKKLFLWGHVITLNSC